MIEKTLVLFKPDAVQRGIVGEILSRFEKVGMKIVALKMLNAREEQLAEHYFKDDEWLVKKGKGIIEKKGYSKDYDPKKAGQEILDGLKEDMKISPIIALVLEGHNAVRTVKRLTGPTNIDDAPPGTIRGDYSHDTFELANISNRPNLTIIHATDNPAEAEREISIWFKKDEIHSYVKPEEQVHYRKREIFPEEKKMRVVLLGAPGAGKGTYASRLKEKYKIPHISTGDLLRDAIKNKTELGMEAKEFMDKGELVPDEIVIGLLKERLAENDARNGMLLDGFPRTIEQAKMLDKLIGIDAVLNFEVEEDTILNRITTRRICKNCGQIFNTVRIPPKNEGICDHCEGELFQRDDDKEETIKERFKIYLRNTTPITEFYKEKGVLKSLNSNIDLNNPECTTIEECMKILDELKKRS